LFYVGERPRYGLDVSGSCFSAHFWPGHKKLRLETGVYFVMIRSCIPDPVNSGKEHARVCFVIKVARGAGSRPDEASEWGDGEACLGGHTEVDCLGMIFFFSLSKHIHLCT
jgi:hypothetical protein